MPQKKYFSTYEPKLKICRRIKMNTTATYVLNFNLLALAFWDNYLEQLTDRHQKHAYINNKQRCGVSAIITN